MNYKRIIKNKEVRLGVLKKLKFIPDLWMIRLQYWIQLNRHVNLKNPQRYTEKLQWYKLHYRNPLMKQCADKYGVRDYIKFRGLGDILKENYGVYDSFKDIDFEKLPNKFVLKTTNGSGTNIFCEDKEHFDFKKAEKLLSNWLKRDYYALGREWAYKGIKPRIIAEEYLEDREGAYSGINDYKFVCFNGEPYYIAFDVDRFKDHKSNVYDVNWNFIDASVTYPNMGDVAPKPEGLDELVRVAKILSRDFPNVRVDLYWVNGKVYFGELTFYSGSGYLEFEPDDFDYEVGSHMCLDGIIKD